MKKLLLAMLTIMVLSIALVSAADFSITSLNPGSGDLGDTVSYTLGVQNDDPTEILSFTCTSTALTDGTYTITAPSISDINLVDPLTLGTSSFDVTIPGDSIAAGLYTSTITCIESLNQTEQITTLQLTVNSADDFTTDSELDVEVAVDENDDFLISVTNIGSSNLDFTAEFESEDGDLGYIEDNDGDEITITFTTLPTAVAPGETATITMNVDVEDGVDSGENYEGIITVTAGTVTVDVSLDVDLEAQICDEGLQGDMLSISIDEPGNNDNFKPGDTVNVEFDVENEDNNDDIDVEVQLILWDSTDGEEVDTYDVDEFNLDDNEDESFDFDYELPTDLDEDHTYYLYVKANEDGDEDDQCIYERVGIDIELDDDDVVITSTDVSPSTLECGDEFVLTVEVESIGTDEQEDVYIEIDESELDISASTDYFDLGDHNDNDNDYRATFNLDLPSDLDAGTYYLDVKVYDPSGSLYDSELVSISVGTCGSSSSDDDDDIVEEEDLVEGVDVEILVDNDFDVEGFDKLTIPVIIQNKGNEDTTITLSVDDISWADVEGTEYLSNIQAGQSLHAYVYLDLETDVTGIHDLVIEVEDGNGVTTSEIITLDFGEGNEITGNATGIGDWNTEVWYWIIGIVILVAILIILIRVLTR